MTQSHLQTLGKWFLNILLQFCTFSVKIKKIFFFSSSDLLSPLPHQGLFSNLAKKKLEKSFLVHFSFHEYLGPISLLWPKLVLHISPLIWTLFYNFFLLKIFTFGTMKTHKLVPISRLCGIYSCQHSCQNWQNFKWNEREQIAGNWLKEKFSREQ